MESIAHERKFPSFIVDSAATKIDRVITPKKTRNCAQLSTRVFPAAAKARSPVALCPGKRVGVAREKPGKAERFMRAAAKRARTRSPFDFPPRLSRAASLVF